MIAVPIAECRVYRSQFDGDEHFIHGAKPHLLFYGGMWHCQMSGTMEYAHERMGLSWKNWFLYNLYSNGFEHGRHIVYEYMKARPRYNGRRVDDILAIKGLL